MKRLVDKRPTQSCIKNVNYTQRSVHQQPRLSRITRAMKHPRSLTPLIVKSLQRSYGNRATANMIQRFKTINEDVLVMGQIYANGGLYAKDYIKTEKNLYVGRFSDGKVYAGKFVKP